MNSPIALVQYGYTSEWALAKLFPVIFENGLEQAITLVGISGREQSIEDVRDRLFQEIGKKSAILQSGKTWRIENTLREIKSAVNLLDYLSKKKIDYRPFSDAHFSSPKYAAGAIFTKNTTHYALIKLLLELGKHVLCEKPLVTVTDENHEADRGQLEGLKALVRQYKDKLIMMDCEHYSAKRAARAFFENIGEIVACYGRISEIKGCSKELDDPDKPRTKALLSKENRTGLLLDMGVHYFGLVTNIKGEIGHIIDAEYGRYPGYDVETYAKTRFTANGNLFYDNVPCEFTFAKFIDKLKEPEAVETKKVKVTFSQNTNSKARKATVVTIDFAKGTVTDSKGREWYTDASGKEYFNILKDFYNAVLRNQQPRTSFEHSVKSLEAIWGVYFAHPMQDHTVEVYGR